MPLASSELNDAELAELDALLARAEGGRIPNAEALDGFFAALACCPDLILPSEYLPVIQAGETEDGDLDFESLEEAQRFMALVSQHWNHVNHQLNEGEVYLPLILQNEHSDTDGNDWAKGFLAGTHLRHEIWAELINDEEQGGAILPIMALAYENHPDPSMRPFKEPIDGDWWLSVPARSIQGRSSYTASRRRASPRRVPGTSRASTRLIRGSC